MSTAIAQKEMSASHTTQPVLVTSGWIAHWLLRWWLATVILVYGLSKVILVQMGVADYGDALVQFGEMSPMGLLWRFMAYSPAFQVLSGLAEVVAAALLLFRRTAGIGGLLGAAAMGFVFMLNLFFDVPVKQLSLALTVGCLVVALPYVRRYLRAAGSAAVPAGPIATPIPWPRLHRVTRVLSPVLAVLVLIGSAVAASQFFSFQQRDSELPGVYRVVADTRPPAAQLADDDRWQQVSFGQWDAGRGSRMAIRYANGDLQLGVYTLQGQTITAKLHPIQRGATPLPLPVERTVTLQWRQMDDGSLRITGDGRDMRVSPDSEARFLFDRGFSWQPRKAVNR